MKRYLFILGFVHLLLWSKTCPAEPLIVGALDFPPYYVVKGVNQVEGIYIDFLKELLNNAGLDYKIMGYPPKRLYTYVASGEVNIWMGTIGVEAYEGKTLVSPQKISDIHLRIYTIGDKESPVTKEDLKGKTFLIIHGYNYGGLIEYLSNPLNKITLDTSNSHESAFTKLQKGRADYLIDYKEPAEAVLKNIHIPNLKSNDFSTVGIYFHVSKKTPNAENVLNKMMESFFKLKSENKLPF